MNKEEIEESKKCLIGIIENTYAEEKAIKLNNLRKYMQYLEQKESKLDKVTNKLKLDIENANNNIKHMEEKTILQTIARELAIGMRDYSKEILDIIEGE